MLSINPYERRSAFINESRMYSLSFFAAKQAPFMHEMGESLVRLSYFHFCINHTTIAKASIYHPKMCILFVIKVCVLVQEAHMQPGS